MADLEAPSAGLRPPGVRLVNKSNAAAKVSIVVPAGDELEVGANVAAQLTGQTSAFAVAGVVEPESDAVETAGGGSARRRSGRRQ